MSGAGRSTTANVLEDLGWYVVDNLPPQMLPQLAELARASTSPGPGADDPPRRRGRRRPQPRRSSPTSARSLAELRDGPGTARRSSSSTPPTRRWSAGSRASAARTRCRARAGCSTASSASAPCSATCAPRPTSSSTPPGSTSTSSPAKVTSALRRRRRGPAAHRGHVVRVQVRPPARRRLRLRPALPAQPVLGARAAAPHSGSDEAVAEFVLRQEGAEEFVDRVVAPAWTRWSQGYIREGRRYVTLAVGCTGGKHRSVAIAEELAERLRQRRRRRHLPRAPRPGAGVSRP